jgi:DHA1 family bicyclomycin/chloramphenicol resistance-like MFS transporter
MQEQHGAQRLILLWVALAGLVPLSIALYLPGLPAMAQALGSSAGLAQMTLGVFLAGLSIGTLACGPLSERYGRRPLLLAGLGLYLVASLGCLQAGHVGMLLLCRFVQALGAAGALLLAHALVRDRLAEDEVGPVVALLHLVTLVAALVAPLAGAWLVTEAGWRSVFLVLPSLAGLCFVAIWLGLGESLQGERQPVAVSFAGYLQVLGERRAAPYLFCLAFSFGGLCAFITAAPFVFVQYLGLSPWACAGVLAVSVLGILFVLALNARWVPRVGRLAPLRLGAWMATVAGVALAGAGLLGWALPAVVVLGALLFAAATGLIAANASAGLQALFPGQALTAGGLAMALQFASGTAFSWMVSAFADGTSVPMAVALCIAGLGCLLGYFGVLDQAQPGSTLEQGR